ncbi:hypothetical protein [Saccharopolyspora rosea]|uniref:Uncharacterized protein n=1 Tax=Saccharopolyspora rosea TaxID=524884 RepID=A0ABW3FLA9_9PSEU|nr:hypothetical protein [Saccharopolyspora rosea]
MRPTRSPDDPMRRPGSRDPRRPRDDLHPDVVVRPRARHARARPVRSSRAGTALRGITGSLAAGSLVLGLALVGMQFWATAHGQEGPGLPAVIWQVVSGLVAVVLQAVSDRRRDTVGGWALVCVLVVVFGSLWFWWWA